MFHLYSHHFDYKKGGCESRMRVYICSVFQRHLSCIPACLFILIICFLTGYTGTLSFRALLNHGTCHNEAALNRTSGVCHTNERKKRLYQ